MNKTKPLSFFLSLLLVACGTTPGDDDPTEPSPDAGQDVAEDTETDIAPTDTEPADVPPNDVGPTDVGPPDVVDAGEDTEPDCPRGPQWQYESEDPNLCEEIGLTCEFPGDTFSNECGCGCFFPRSPDCPYDDLGPLYQEAGGSPEECAAIFFECEEGGEMVADDCGCGCVYGPPVCLDPDAPGVSYLGRSPQECELIDYDCGGAVYFGNPCGCGCFEEVCPDGPAVDYVATSARECSEIDFGCPDGWTGFDLGECGCGCQIATCNDEEFLPPTGLASNIELGGFCDFLVACSQFSLDDGGMSDPFSFFYAEARCREGTSSGCPDGTESICEVPIGELGFDDIANACAITAGTATVGMLCSGDR